MCGVVHQWGDPEGWKFVGWEGDPWLGGSMR